MICDVCRPIFGTDDADALWPPCGGDPRTMPHHWTYQSLTSSVDTGCFICTGLWMVLLRVQQTNTSFKQNLSIGSTGARPISTIQMAKDLVDGDKSFAGSVTAQLPNVSDSFRCLLNTFDPWRGRIPSAHTKSAETTAIFKTWVVNCIENHQECRKPTLGSTTWYPTRLLDCKASRTQQDVVSLVESSRAAISGAYITLSHCWGKAHCLSLTTGNHARLSGHFPSSDLPRLYQDAVYVTRQLGVRYLWIDSLCIIQEGDGTDWLREIKTMHQVYYKSFCNISALDAADGNDSLFHARRPESLTPQPVRVRYKGRWDHGTLSHPESRQWEAVDLALLNTRAWVLQERLLSPRILHFGRTQVYWECQQANIRELEPDHDFSTIRGRRQRGLTDSEYASIAQKTETPLSDPELGDTDIWDRIDCWYRIVRIYTRCRLTKPGDKLAAISALARLAAGPLRGSYVAGMWENQLASDLLWYVAPDAAVDRQPRPVPYRAPSWSWAAVDQPVWINAPAPGSNQLIKVEGYHIDHETDDMAGLVKGGWLRLRGLLRRVQLLPPRASIDTEDRSAAGQNPWIMVPDGLTVPPSSTRDWDDWSRHQEVYLDAPYEEDQSSENGRFAQGNASGNFYCVPTFSDDPGVYGLILESTKQDQDTFRRIGAFSIDPPAAEEGVLGTRVHHGTFEELGDRMRSVVIV